MSGISCSKKKAVSRINPDESWEPYISAYTSGIISRESTVRVVLRNQVVLDSVLNKPIDNSPFSFTPAIKGTSVWIDSRTIEFKPEKTLEGGKTYKAAFHISKYLDVPEKLRTFVFEFAVIKQSLDVSFNALEPLRNDDLKWQRITGKVRTADVEQADRVEEIIKAKLNGKTLPFRWEHEANRQVHIFTIDSIDRGNDSSTLLVFWNGKPIDVENEGTKSIHIPAIDEFSIIDSRALPTGEQGFSISFSDPLLANQSVVGLITVNEDNSPRFAVDGNEIRVYFSRRVGGVVNCVVNPGIQNIAGKRFKETVRLDIKIESLKPAVRFTGKGVILPNAANLTVPFEVVNLNAVDVKVIRIYENNIPQFLQVNDLEGSNELRRVGRTIFRQTVQLNTTTDMQNRWIRSGFDVFRLVGKEQGALYRISLSFKKEYSLYPCEPGDSANFRKRDDYQPLTRDDENEDDEYESSYWDYSEDYGYEFDWQEWENNRDNPCHPAYYRESWGHKIIATRNFLSSDIGISAKKGAADTLIVAITNLTTAQPLANVNVSLFNYQNIVTGSGKTDADGFAAVAIKGPGRPFLCVADNGTQKGYLKLDNGSSLPVSHFDIGGAAVQKGLKGYLYGERGVWRPGDSLYLTFVLEDKTGRLPAGHPVTLELVNPRGQVIQTLTQTEPVGRFYDFRTATAPDAPTGNYTARVKAGGTTFEQKLKVEMVMPNRLKVRLDFETDTLVGGDIHGKLTSQWLTGAMARNLKADIELTVKTASTAFAKYRDYVFDDPARTFAQQTSMIFEGAIDADGQAAVNARVSTTNAPGMLQATFRTRVFEAGGAFSIDKYTLPFSPYNRYVGILTPRGDRSRGMLLTDTVQTVHIVTVSPLGKPLAARRVQMTLYKVKWRWWWERGEESLSDYLSSKSHEVIACDTIATPEGKGIWSFRIAYPEWGRFLIRAVDLDGGHASGKTIYMDWPQWAGRAQKEIPGGATVLAFSSDKQEYSTGEKAQIVIPSGEGGRILISLENGSRVLRRFWVDSKAQETAVSVDVVADMAPTTYISAMYIQKYAQTANDLPMRMYGVIPINVVNPDTRLHPVIKAPPVLEPDSKAEVTVREQNSREMTYTLAVVDEGLLDLTRFETPDLWKHFYQREALGVMWWDLYDLVCGAFGSELTRILSIGGDEGVANPGQKRGNRFPPMVRFLGPYHLKKGASAAHTINIPQYIGSVRIMVVAGFNGAYGSADTAVPVRKPLMLLGTLPRVLGPQENVKLPVSVFALEPAVRDVSVSVKVEGPATVRGEAKKHMKFQSIGDELVEFDLATGEVSGWAKVTITANSSGQRAQQVIDIEVRNPAKPVTDVVEKVLSAGESWSSDITLPGTAGTNSAILEISQLPAIDLTRRLDYLIGYPHGCVEQVTSRVFPQLYLSRVVNLSDRQKNEIQKAIQEGIWKLPEFQSSGGGFAFWPGGGDADPWVSSYVGHFLLEAKNEGYTVPEHIMRQWIRYQNALANGWSGKHWEAQLTQAYRLYTLALAGAPDIGAMNRLRESTPLDIAARWRLSAAYAMAGQNDVARQLVNNLPSTVNLYTTAGSTYGSDVRDKAMILETLILLKEKDRAAKIALDIARSLTAAGQWMSTQSTAYALMAMVKYAGMSELNGRMDVAYTLSGAKETALQTTLTMLQQPLTIGFSLTKTAITCQNRAKSVAYVRVISRGIPAFGEEKDASHGLEMTVRYLTRNGKEMTPDRVEQGSDFIAEVTVAAQRGQGPFEQVALSQLFASGWEIRNTRFDGTASSGDDAFVYRDIRDDRVHTYFNLGANSSRRYRIQLHASYIGSFYLPPVYSEAMYDGTVNARTRGMRVEVVEPGS
jgi:uncharacterized protein YfaS (alpha-2-macroglobulin family)